MNSLLMVPLALCLLCSIAGAQEAGAALIDFRPPLTDEVLFNPGMGLYLQYPPLDAKADEWFMKLHDIAYYRLDWSEVQPQETELAFDAYFKPKFDFWVGQHGKRVAFRVMCENTHSSKEYVTPKWVFDRGVPGVKLTALNGKTQTDPVFWDDRYLDVQCEFIAKLGQYLDGRPGLEFVDIGSIGEWGEMHLARWGSDLLRETGFTEAKYNLAYRRVIDAYVKAFPNTRIFLNVGGQKHLSINDYAAIHGVNFRQDGLNPSGASYDCGEWLYKPYSRRGVICNFEFHSGYTEMLQKHWDVKQTIEKGLSAPISYLNTNLFGGSGYRKAPPEVQEMLRDAGRRLGYRLEPLLVQHPPQLRLSPSRAGRLPVRSTWRNSGIAPCSESFAICWALADPSGKTVCEQTEFPLKPTTQWWPGEEQQVATVLRLPEGLPAGQYRLMVGLADAHAQKRLNLPLAGRTEAGLYPLDAIAGEALQAEQRVVFSEDFEGDLADWRPDPGMTAQRVEDQSHGGKSCLSLSGAVATSWNYLTRRVSPTAVPFGVYRLTAWLRVDELGNPKLPPFLKLAVNDQAGKWIANYTTGRYDVTKLGTWQKLECDADLPANAGSLDLGVEKGDNTTPVTVKLRLDDVKVELVEAP